MIPKIIFQRAHLIYENHLIKVPGYKMPSDAVYKAKVRSIEKRWSKWGNKVLGELKKITNLKWIEKDVRCYIVSGTATSFSHPLTLKIYDSTDDMFDLFTHELIHRLLTNVNHPKKFLRSKISFLADYDKEPLVTKRHILVHALHAHMLLKFFGKARLKRAVAFSKKSEYIRSWNIVNTLGYNIILKRVFKT